MKIIDTHLHIWDKDSLSLPWLDLEGDILNRTYTLEDYKNDMRADKGYEIESSVYVEVDCARGDKERENREITKRCQDPEQKLGGACISGYLDEEGFPAYLDRFLSPCIKGVRQVLHIPEALPGTCQKPVFVENVRYLGTKGLVFEGCVRNSELPDLYELAKACPDTVVVLDHMGIVDPDIIARENPDEKEWKYREDWIKNMDLLSSLQNVVCKISGLNPAGAWSEKTLLPAVDIALDRFGKDRVMFASNYPVCNVSTGLSPWIEALMSISKRRGNDFQESLFYKNAARIYRL